MARIFTEEENRKWRESLPKKTIAVKVVMKSDEGNVLLVKPNYKITWQLPGGNVDKNEEPRDALIREVSEELGMALEPDKLECYPNLFLEKNMIQSF